MATSLIVLQPTSFCNLDCSYCYLPDRARRGTISREALSHFFRVLFNSTLNDDCRIVWHAGEPLVSGIGFFEAAFSIQQQHNREGRAIEHWIQTNGTLIDEDWCALFKAHDIRVSISIDGPEQMHDRFRRDRRGAGTLTRVEKAIRLLQRFEVKYNALSVVTRASLPYAAEYFAYLRNLGVRQVGINIEELNTQSGQSSMAPCGQDAALDAVAEEYGVFFRTLFDLWKVHHREIEIREFAELYRVVNTRIRNPAFRRISEEHAGLDILNVKKNGDVSTFAPELVEGKDGDPDAFVLGNVRTLHSFDELRRTSKYRRLEAEVNSGIEKCRKGCAYFDFCGGGHLSAKYFENGTLDSAETRYCKLHRRLLTDIVIDGLAAA